MTTGYKIVISINKQLWSFSGRLQGNRRYILNKVVKPLKDYGPLAVFKTLSQAKKFLRGNYSYHNASIYKCKYELSNRDSLWTLNSRLDAQDTPEGTYFAESIELLERVQ